MDNLFCIRQFEKKDQDSVIQLWKDCNLVVPQNNPVKDIDIKLKVQPELFLVGLLDESIISSVMSGFDGHRGWINYLSVSPLHQKKGYAHQMIEAVEKKLKGLGCPKINLQVRTSNKSVINFYESVGFSEDKVLSMGKRL